MIEDKNTIKPVGLFTLWSTFRSEILCKTDSLDALNVIQINTLRVLRILFYIEGIHWNIILWQTLRSPELCVSVDVFACWSVHQPGEVYRLLLEWKLHGEDWCFGYLLWFQTVILLLCKKQRWQVSLDVFFSSGFCCFFVNRQSRFVDVIWFVTQAFDPINKSTDGTKDYSNTVRDYAKLMLLGSWKVSYA